MSVSTPNCHMCMHKRETLKSGWCYMFRHEPNGWCSKFIFFDEIARRSWSNAADEFLRKKDKG